MDAPNTPVVSPGGTTPAAAPEAGAPMAGAVEAPASWMGPLADESLRTNQTLGKYKDLESALRGHIELEKHRNERSGVKPITPESTAEEVAAYRQAMGIPGAPEQYELGELSFPEAATPTQEQMGAFKGIAHSLHLTPAQVNGILQWYSQDISTQWNALNEQQEAQSRETMTALSKRYGAQAGAMAQLAHTYVAKRWGDDGLRALDFQPGNPSSVGNSPVLLEILIESAKLTGHDQFIVGDGRNGLMSKESAQARYSELASQFYTHPEGSPEREALGAEMRRLAPLQA